MTKIKDHTSSTAEQCAEIFITPPAEAEAEAESHHRSSCNLANCQLVEAPAKPKRIQIQNDIHTNTYRHRNRCINTQTFAAPGGNCKAKTQTYTNQIYKHKYTETRSGRWYQQNQKHTNTD